MNDPHIVRQAEIDRTLCPDSSAMQVMKFPEKPESRIFSRIFLNKLSQMKPIHLGINLHESLLLIMTLSDAYQSSCSSCFSYQTSRFYDGLLRFLAASIGLLILAACFN